MGKQDNFLKLSTVFGVLLKVLILSNIFTSLNQRTVGLFQLIFSCLNVSCVWRCSPMHDDAGGGATVCDGRFFWIVGLIWISGLYSSVFKLLFQWNIDTYVLKWSHFRGKWYTKMVDLWIASLISCTFAGAWREMRRFHFPKCFKGLQNSIRTFLVRI